MVSYTKEQIEQALNFALRRCDADAESEIRGEFFYALSAFDKDDDEYNISFTQAIECLEQAGYEFTDLETDESFKIERDPLVQMNWVK